MTQTSKEYAEALFELALGDGRVAEVSEALKLVETSLAETPGYREMLASPAIGKDERLASLDAVFGDQVPKIVLALLRMMVSRGHISSLDGMFRAYEELAREQRGETVARVTSAVALTEDEASRLKEKLEKKTGRKVTLSLSVDPSLLGGIRVETDGRVIDGTVRNKLNQIKEVMDS